MPPPIKRLKLWSQLILIASALLLSGAVSEKVRPHPSPTINHGASSQQPPTAQQQPASPSLNPPPTTSLSDGLEATLVDYTWWLVGVGALQGVILFFQAYLLKRTLQHARLSERPWVSIDNKIEVNGLRELGDFRRDLTPVKQNLRNPDWIMRIHARYSFLNSGKTPARITEMGLVFRTTVELKLPKEPNYGALGRKLTFILPPNRPFETSAVLPLTPAHIVDLISSNQVMIFYGYVKYVDVLDETHESRFCQIARIPPIADYPIFFAFDGPEAYNKYT